MCIHVVHYKREFHTSVEFYPTLAQARKRYRKLIDDPDITIGDIRDAITEVSMNNRNEMITQLNNIFSRMNHFFNQKPNTQISPGGEREGMVGRK